MNKSPGYSLRAVMVALALTLAASLVGAAVPNASAVGTGSVSEFPIATPSSKPLGMTTGPDGNLWFTETEAAKIGKMSSAGVLLAEYDIPGDHPYPIGIVTGSDGNLWFADAGESRIGRMLTNGAFTGFAVPSAEPAGIAAGPDGNIWFTDAAGNNIGKMSTSGELIDQYPITSPAAEVVAGPDGNMWFTEEASNTIGKMSVAGNLLAEYSVPTPGAKPAGIIAGVDGNMWFTQEDGNKIAKSSVGGVITEYAIPTPGSEPTRIVAGSDGNMWFTASAANKIVRVTTTGSMTEFPIPTANSRSGGTTPGPDGNIWFTELDGNKIGRAAVGPPKPAVTARGLNSAAISATVYPGGATATSVIQCARNATFRSGLVQRNATAGSPSSSSKGVKVRGSCTDLRVNTKYFARIKSVYKSPAGGPARTNTLYTTAAQFRTKTKQVPRANCVLIPPPYGSHALKPNSLTRLTKRNCVTSAGQRVVVRGESVLRGDVRLPRVFVRNGSWWIQTYATPTWTRLVWSAPATSTFAPYLKTVVRKT